MLQADVHQFLRDNYVHDPQSRWTPLPSFRNEMESDMELQTDSLKSTIVDAIRHVFGSDVVSKKKFGRKSNKCKRVFLVKKPTVMEVDDVDDAVDIVNDSVGDVDAVGDIDAVDIVNDAVGDVDAVGDAVGDVDAVDIVNDAVGDVDAVGDAVGDVDAVSDVDAVDIVNDAVGDVDTDMMVNDVIESNNVSSGMDMDINSDITFLPEPNNNTREMTDDYVAVLTVLSGCFILHTHIHTPHRHTTMA